MADNNQSTSIFPQSKSDQSISNEQRVSNIIDQSGIVESLHKKIKDGSASADDVAAIIAEFRSYCDKNNIDISKIGNLEEGVNRKFQDELSNQAEQIAAAKKAEEEQQRILREQAIKAVEGVFSSIALVALTAVEQKNNLQPRNIFEGLADALSLGGGGRPF